jgi:hypothetical protein
MFYVNKMMVKIKKLSTITIAIAAIATVATVGIMGGIGQQQVASGRPICVQSLDPPPPVAGVICLEVSLFPGIACQDGVVVEVPDRGLTITCP